MKPIKPLSLLVLVPLVALLAGADKPVAPVPLVHGHAHNDYEHARPLLDALDRGYCSVEADVYLVDGQLLVAHNLKDVKPDRTLQSLYLDPLRGRARENGGRIYAGGPGFQLFIDVKSEAAPTYAALRDVLKQYADILTTSEAGKSEVRAVTAVISGNRDVTTMKAETVHYAAWDGRLNELKSKFSTELVPLISSAWSPTFTWKGEGAMPAEEKQKLKDIVEKVHAQGRQIRFWSAPDSPVVWTELRSAGVDWLSIDDLAAGQAFLLKEMEAGKAAAAPKEPSK